MATVCTITGTIKNADGTINVDAYVMVEPASQPSFADTTGIVIYPMRKLVDPLTGSFAIDLLVGATIKFRIPCIGLERTFVVPNEDTKAIEDII